MESLYPQWLETAGHPTVGWRSVIVTAGSLHIKHIVRARTRVNATHSAPPPPSVSAMRVAWLSLPLRPPETVHHAGRPACLTEGGGGFDDDYPMGVALETSEWMAALPLGPPNKAPPGKGPRMRLKISYARRTPNDPTGDATLHRCWPWASIPRTTTIAPSSLMRSGKRQHTAGTHPACSVGTTLPVEILSTGAGERRSEHLIATR
eukprot:scaffold30993_cov242-Isochrysis_galbana.AAC.7